MPKNGSAAGSSQSPLTVRKDKKRKHASLTAPSASSSSSPPKKQGRTDGTTLQLDDILSTLSAGTGLWDGKEGKRKEKEKERPMKKAKQDAKVASGGESKGQGKGKSVSALELLMGVGSGSVEQSVKERKTKGPASAKHEVREEKGISAGNVVDSGKQKQGAKAVADNVTANERLRQSGNDDVLARRDAHAASTTSQTAVATRTTQPQAPTSTSTFASPPPPSLALTPSTPITTTNTTNPSTPITAADTISDAASTLLKPLRAHLRLLTATFERLGSERVLVDRIWYKNSVQFKSALWWRVGVCGVRRALHRLLLLPSVPSDGEGEGEGSGSVAVRAVCSVAKLYAGLGGGLPAFHAAASCSFSSSGNSPYPSLPRFDAKPSAATAREFLATAEAQSHLRETLQTLHVLRSVLQVVKRRSHAAGKLFLVHLNTPPAPTFAPLVSACFALVAGVCAEVEGGGGADTGDAEAEGLERVVGRIMDVLQGLKRG
ncbi:hypothetical protein EX895_004798 [Sporisorium graminicola]|uniref:Uncharacterized protein n=1 Tax=Sporisorium graminicola TaxID=280036 RepID=A0A4U7KP42_9BASI|nr:hypothetical protein EX895_004798 [Sporisorium graminicola]TKY85973.1 hypothetical protein EX895_004798 [Sporisorium graminicola]